MKVPREDATTDQMVDAILAVNDIIRTSRSETYRGLESEIDATLEDKRFDCVRPGCDLFKQRLTKSLRSVQKKEETMASIRSELQDRCESYVAEAEGGPNMIVNDILPFIRENSTVLVHGCGSLLSMVLAHAVKTRHGVKFYVCEGAPKNTGKLLMERTVQLPEGYNVRDALRESCTIVPDSAVAALMSEVDFAVMGANCVTENGGLVHGIGSLQLAMVAEAMRVPVYVLSQTFKFTRIFPLSTQDIEQPDEVEGKAKGKSVCVPLLEFVNPSQITLVFTEQGIMPPSAVADEMFRIHNVQEQQVIGSRR